MQLVIDRD